ncbi:MAG: nucleotidyltransferase family protein [Hyphomicrobiales bacterium]|nr:nucleotidyltransferase family protein [Hyphomicrobiales bacterium]
MMKTTGIAAIILAAGRSTRMGATNKLIAPWQGKTPLEFVCAAATTSKCDKTIVVTGHQQTSIVEKVNSFDVLLTHNSDYRSGMASSIKKGILVAQENDANAVLVLLGDMPGITSAMINKMIAASQNNDPKAIIVATCEGKRGNPLLWPKMYFDQLLALEGDQGARQIVSRYNDQIIELELGPGVMFDLDTPESFRAGN